METLEKETVKLDTFDGHLFLLCKGHYGNSRTNFFNDIRKIWTIRCGLPVTNIDNRIDEPIADRLASIIERIEGKLDMSHVHQKIAFDLSRPDNCSVLETLIWIYRSILNTTKVREDGVQLVSYPETQKRLINSVLFAKPEKLENINTFDMYDVLINLDKR